MEMADGIGRKGEVERFVDLKVWDESGSLDWSSQITILVVERFEKKCAQREKEEGGSKINLYGK